MIDKTIPRKAYNELRIAVNYLYRKQGYIVREINVNDSDILDKYFYKKYNLSTKDFFNKFYPDISFRVFMWNMWGIITDVKSFNFIQIDSKYDEYKSINLYYKTLEGLGKYFLRRYGDKSNLHFEKVDI